jgi:uncharacterized membrane-anchored protein
MEGKHAMSDELTRLAESWEAEAAKGTWDAGYTNTFIRCARELRAAVKERGEDTELRRVAKEVLDRLRESKMIAATAQHFECAVELKQLADRLDAAMQQQQSGGKT